MNQQYHQTLLTDSQLKDLESKRVEIEQQIESRKQELKEIFQV